MKPQLNSIIIGFVSVLVLAIAAVLIIMSLPKDNMPVDSKLDVPVVSIPKALEAVPVASAPTPAEPSYDKPYNIVVKEPSDNNGTTVMANTYCGFTYELPAGWVTGGIVGGTVISSPEDQRKTAAYDKSHPDVEGDGTNFRSLYLSCEDDVSEYLQRFRYSGQNFASVAERATLADAFVSKAFHGGGEVIVNSIMEIGGKAAYEIVRTNESIDGRMLKNYSIVVELSRVLVIEIGETAYESLSSDARGIIDSLSFEPTANQR